jgi:hypothetical protein
VAGEDVLQRIHDQYGSAFDWMLGIPEVAALLIEAVNPDAGFSPSTFEAKLHDTTWWKTTPREQREAQALWGTDIATYEANREKVGSDLFKWATQMGVTFTMPEIQDIRTRFNDLGFDVDSSQAQIELGRWLRGHKERITGDGLISGAAQKFLSVVKGEYFNDFSRDTALDWGIKLALGETDEAGLRSYLGEWTAAAHPWLADRLKAGETLADIVNPLRDVVAKELELGSLEDVNMTSSNEWKWLMGVPWLENGEMRLPTAYEAMTEIRRHKPQWWQTSHGREADAAMTETMLRAFGKVA